MLILLVEMLLMEICMGKIKQKVKYKVRKSKGKKRCTKCGRYM